MKNFIYNIPSEKNSMLPIYLRSACDRYIQESVYRPNGMDMSQILIVTDGRGTVKCDGKRYELKRGSAFFTDADVPVEYVNTDGLITAFITAGGSAVQSLRQYFGCDRFVFYDSVNTDKTISDIRLVIDGYYADKSEGELSSMVYSFYTSFFELCSATIVNRDRTIQYIEKNFTEKITLSTLSAETGISVSALCHGFREKFGCSIFGYILNLRLEYAKSILLTSSKATTKYAALSSGFENVSYFCRAYKKKYGTTPTADRKKAFGVNRKTTELL